MLIKVLAPGYYARQDLKTPVRVGIIAMVANMVFNLILVVPLHLAWQSGRLTVPLGHVGLALATSLAAWLNAGLLARGLLASGAYRPAPGWRGFGLRLLLASLAMGLALWWFNPPAALWQAWVWWQRISVLALLCGGGLALYGGLLFAGGLRFGQLRGPQLR
jgi:putative peptidoglycan lipid II flippase